MFEYKQKTKSKVIPVSFISSVLIFFTRLIMKHDVNTLWQLTDLIQKDILNNLLEKEGDKIGCIQKGDPYKKLCIVGITQLMNNENQRLSSEAFSSLTKGMCELIIGRRRHEGNEKADNEIDMSEIAVEFHEQDGSFDRQTFNTLFSIK